MSLTKFRFMERLGTPAPVNAAIAFGDRVEQALNKLQGQVTSALNPSPALENLSASKMVTLSGEYSYGIVSLSDQHNYDPLYPYANTSIMNIVPNGGGPVAITGLTGGTAGRFLGLFNYSTQYALTLRKENSNSTDVNRFDLPADLVIPPLSGCFLYYSVQGNSRWRLFGSIIPPGLTSGPASSVDNTLPRFNGTGGKALQGSGVVVSDANEISGYLGNVNAQTGTTYTLVAADTGKIVECANASAIAVTFPNSLPVGSCGTLVQAGAGQITAAAGSGATLRNRQTQFKTAGQYAMLSWYVRSNAGGTAAEYVLAGDTAA